jgi:hypothetical protein
MSATLDDPDHSGSAGNRDGNSVSNKDLTLFTKLLEPKYTGDPDMLDVFLDRIDDAEDRLAVLSPPVILDDPQRVSAIVAALDGNARQWWQGAKNTMLRTHYDAFLSAFVDHHQPPDKNLKSLRALRTLRLQSGQPVSALGVSIETHFRYLPNDLKELKNLYLLASLPEDLAGTVLVASPGILKQPYSEVQLVVQRLLPQWERQQRNSKQQQQQQPSQRHRQQNNGSGKNGSYRNAAEPAHNYEETEVDRKFRAGQYQKVDGWQPANVAALHAVFPSMTPAAADQLRAWLAANNICWSCRKEGHSSFDPVCERYSKNKARADSSKSK